MSVKDSKARPPKARLVLRIGITGKRAIPDSEHKRIRDALADIFEALALFLIACRTRHEYVWADEQPLLRIISGLAEGADQIAAKLAVARMRGEIEHDRKAETRLAAILPFPRNNFACDFKEDPSKPEGQKKRTPEEYEEAKARFENLLQDASEEAILEIDDEASALDRNHGYAALRDTLLEHSDILVAVSDDVDGGTGGTVDVIRIAVQQGIPVIKVSTKSPKLCLMRAADLDAASQAPVEDEEFEPRKHLPEKLAKVLRLIVEPPVSVRHEAHDAPRSGRVRLEQYLQEEFKPAWFGRIFKTFRDAMVAWPRRSRRRRCWLAAKALTKSLWTYAIETPEQKISALWPTEKSEVPFVADSANNKFQRIHIARYAWADTLSVRYADATRSSYIAIAFLGAIAVFVGLSALFVLREEPALIVKIIVLFAEGGILLVAGWIFFGPAHRERWHERMVEYRALAELLRHQRFVYALGASDRLERTADRTWREPDAWVGWYVRATMRELGFPAAVLSAPYRRRLMEIFQREELDGQRAYNNTVATRSTTIDERLSYLIQRAWRLTVIAGFFGGAFLGILYLIKHYHWCGYDYVVTTLHYAKPFFTLLMAFVPAVIAAVHGIRFQMEFLNTAERAATTERELSQLSDKLGALGAAPGRRYSLFYVRAANEAMSSDLAGWSNVYRGKAPEPP
jgi:hypothetical protein